MVLSATAQPSSPSLVSLWSVGVFLTWTVTSFLCHNFAKVFLRETAESGPSQFSAAYLERGAIDASMLTLIQVGLCYTLIQVQSSGGAWNLAVVSICHVVATFFTNVSMACMYASSTFAIKLMEPITSAVVQYALLSTPLSPLAVLSLPVIVGGAIIFSGNPTTQSNLPFGIAAAFTSNIILGLRNVYVKMGSGKQSGSGISLRPVNRGLVITTMLCAGGFGAAWAHGYIPDRVVYLAAICSLSGVFHVLYSYVSTGVVLLHLSVVSHAVTNILKRVLVVLLLYMTGSRSASTTNFLGLGVCVLGLFVYAWSKRSTPTHSDENDQRNAKRSFMPELCLSTPVRMMLLVAVALSSTLAIGVSNTVPVSIEPNAATNGLQLHLPISQTNLNGSKSTASDDFHRTFTHQAYDLPSREDLLPSLDGYLAQHADDIRHFLQEDLYREPNRSSFLSSKLRTPVEITKEAQRLHFDFMAKELDTFKYAILFDIASFENKGDPCITVGETYFLARMKLQLVYYCSSHTCTQNNNRKNAVNKAKKYSTKELVILVHGGGNISGYPHADISRFFIFEAFKNYKIFVFPQSIWARSWNFEHPHFKRCQQNYCCHENVTFVMRDHLSYSIAKKYFKGATKIIMAPDMAFQIGPMKRFISPVFDIMWIRRSDKETPGYKTIPAAPPGIRVHVSDWWKWLTPYAPKTLEHAHYICTNGFFYLQRGRVVITDRLHGHILSTLLNIPHVLIDNKAHKLSAYHESWTASLENTVITNDPSKAMDLAMELLKKYDSTLPPRVPFMHIDEYFKGDQTFGEAEMSYT